MATKEKATEEAGTQREIAEIWKQVEARVLELAGGDRSKIKRNLEIEDILKYVDEAQKTDKKTAEKYGTIKTIFNNSLKCIQTVGGIVSDGASLVFAPSGMCFNAISFVIQAWQGYEGIFESLSGLLERCMDFLDRLTYYKQGGMDAKLTKVACQHLQLLVEICDRTIKLRHSKRVKLMAFTKLFFLNDNDIQGLLDLMTGLVQKETGLVAAQMFDFTSEAAVNSRENLELSQRMFMSIMEDKVDLKNEKELQKRNQIILKALAFDDKKKDKGSEEPTASWRTTYRNFLNFAVKGTGEWLVGDTRFADWASGNIKSKQILAIEGFEGSGKSYLTSRVIEYLQTQGNAVDSASRTLVAFYFLDSDAKDDAKKSNSSVEVSKSLVWQFTQTDISYEKSVASICDRVSELNPQKIWKQLLVENKDRSKMDVTFFVIIDGLGDEIEPSFIELLQAVSADPRDRGVRVFLTGKPRSFEILRDAGAISLDTIPLGSSNLPDVEKFIDAKMDLMDALKDTKRVGVPELRAKIIERLKKETEGDYFKLETSLSKISTLESEKEIDEVLRDAGKGRLDQITAEIERMNNTRTFKEIEEINEIILWLITSRQMFVPSEMESILYLKSGEPSLLPLETKFKTKYTLFKIDSDDIVAFKSSDVKRCIPTKGKISGDNSITDRVEQIRPEEVAIVEHFLNTVCPKDLYRKFGFEQFFKQRKTNHMGNYIYKEQADDAEIKLALTCLRLLTEMRDEKTRILESYGVYCLMDHLAAVDLAKASRELKSKVGPGLVKLFTDAIPIDRLFHDKSEEGWAARNIWIYDDDAVEIVLKWLKDSVVISEISDETTKSWIAGLTAESKPEGWNDDLLKPAAKRLAMHCWQEVNSAYFVQKALWFLLGFYSKLENRKDEKKLRITDDLYNPTLEQIIQIENWSQDILAVEKRDSLWETQMCLILKVFSQNSAAEQRCRSALALDPSNWRASHILASATTSPDEAIQILSTLGERLEKDDEWTKEGDHSSALATIFFDLGMKYWEVEKFNQAVEAFKKFVEWNPSYYDYCGTILSNYFSQKRWTDVVGFLETVRELENGEKHLVEMTLYFANDEAFNETLLTTELSTGCFDLLDKMYNGAIDSAIADGNHDNLCYLQYYYGNVLNHRAEFETKAIEMWEFSLRTELPKTSQRKSHKAILLPLLILALAPLYLRRARNAKRDSDIAEDYLTRLREWLQDEIVEYSIAWPSKLYLARYYHVQGDDAKAKEAVGSGINIAVELLSDEDPTNDIDAFFRLAAIFCALDDDDNALAAWVMATFAFQAQFEKPEATGTARQEIPGDQSAGEDVPKQDDEGDKITTKQTEQNNFAPMTEGDDTKDGNATNGGTVASEANEKTLTDAQAQSIVDYPDYDSPYYDSPARYHCVGTCDGRCGHEWKMGSEIWCCRECIAVQFNEECYQLLKGGKLRRKVCDKDHQFLYVPKWDEEKMKKVKKGFVPVGKEVISLEEWKSRIVKKYLEYDGKAAN